MISPITETATSQGALPPMSSPIGACRRAIALSGMPSAFSSASRPISRRRAPSRPT